MKQIFEMMAQNEHTFGTATNNDVHQQMKLYMWRKVEKKHFKFKGVGALGGIY